MNKEYDIIIVGAGPAGIFAALEFAENSNLKVLILEKGTDIDARVCPMSKNRGGCKKCRPCAAISGWGGAGAYSDGKLTFSKNIGGTLTDIIPDETLENLIKHVDNKYLKYGAPDNVYGPSEDELEEITNKAILANLKLIPSRIRHLGTGRSKSILDGMYKYLKGKVDIKNKTRAVNLVAKNSKVRGVLTSDNEVIYCDKVIAAPGREGSAWLVSQAKQLGLTLSINPVDIGVRVEVPHIVMKSLTDVLYESKLIHYSKTYDDKVRTFCMCPWGEVVTEHNDGFVTVNGHTHSDHKSQNTNFALLVSKTFTEPFKDPISYGKYVAGLANLLGDGIIVQRLGDLLKGQRSTKSRLSKSTVSPTLPEATPGDLSLVFPHRHLVSILEMLEALDKMAPGINSRNTLLYGVEVKFYSSRIKLNKRMESEVPGLFCIGDGAGITRGLMQASASGVLVAREIMKEYKV